MTLNDSAAVRAFYQDKIKEHGLTAEGMAYRSEASHKVRIYTAITLADLAESSTHFYHSMLDLGCGTGMLFDRALWGVYGDDWRNDIPTYTGVDLVPEYINKAAEHVYFYRKLGRRVDTSLKVTDFMEDDTIKPADCVFMIGTLAWQRPDRAVEMLNRAWSLTQKTLIFTVLKDRPFGLNTVHMAALFDDINPTLCHVIEGYVPGELMVRYDV